MSSAAPLLYQGNSLKKIEIWWLVMRHSVVWQSAVLVEYMQRARRDEIACANLLTTPCVGGQFFVWIAELILTR
jgi:hypothetical protein